VDDLQAGLERLAPRLGGIISDLERLSAGASKETWRFRAGQGDLILRRSPGGEAISSAIPLATEAALVQAAHRAGVPVPRVALVCESADGVGEAYVMERLEGETLGRRIVRDEAFAQVRGSLAFRCGEVMAKIHAVPLPGLPELPSMDALRVIGRYEAAYRDLGARRPVLEAAFRWLEKTAPKLAAPVLVHGDFRNGNLMVDRQRGLVAVLDWELAHLGDPAEDLGWICVNSWRFGGAQPVGGFGSYEDLLAGYAAGGGRTVSLAEVKYWQAVGSLKWGVMCLMMYAAYASGRDASVERAMIGRRTSEAEIDLVALMEQAA
jgi:aminoglycoside phosphotransferase (APT) family kinase protein